MSTLIPPVPLTPEEVERACERDGKRYELIDGELKEKVAGLRELFIAGQIVACLNAAMYPAYGIAAAGGR
jgi:hypothetical protein